MFFVPRIKYNFVQLNLKRYIHKFVKSLLKLKTRSEMHDQKINPKSQFPKLPTLYVYFKNNNKKKVQSNP